MVNLLTELDFESIFNSLPAPFLVMDRDFTIVAVNQAFLDATRRPPESLIGINIFVAFRDRKKAARFCQESLERARDKGIADEMPAVSYAITVNGRSEERLWSCTHAPVRDKNGKSCSLSRTPKISRNFIHRRAWRGFLPWASNRARIVRLRCRVPCMFSIRRSWRRFTICAVWSCRLLASCASCVGLILFSNWSTSPFRCLPGAAISSARLYARIA